MLDLTSKAMLAASIRHGMFASRDTVEEALEYASATIERLYNDDKAAMYTALHVVLNTVADKIAELPDSGNQLPEPPPEVRIDHADLPATGAPFLDDRITDIVDQRIKFHMKGFEAIIEKWLEDNVDIEHLVREIIRNMSFSIDVE